MPRGVRRAVGLALCARDAGARRARPGDAPRGGELPHGVGKRPTPRGVALAARGRAARAPRAPDPRDPGVVPTARRVDARRAPAARPVAQPAPADGGLVATGLRPPLPGGVALRAPIGRGSPTTRTGSPSPEDRSQTARSPCPLRSRRDEG